MSLGWRCLSAPTPNPAPHGRPSLPPAPRSARDGATRSDTRSKGWSPGSGDNPRPRRCSGWARPQIPGGTAVPGPPLPARAAPADGPAGTQPPAGCATSGLDRGGAVCHWTPCAKPSPVLAMPQAHAHAALPAVAMVTAAGR